MGYHYVKLRATNAALHTFPNDSRAGAEVTFDASLDNNNVTILVETTDGPDKQVVTRKVELGWLRSIIAGTSPQVTDATAKEKRPIAQGDGDDGA
jgi:hypothetical protein